MFRCKYFFQRGEIMFSIGTYNIMKPNLQKNKYNAAWNERKNQVLGNIRNGNLDVLCIQEVAKPELEWLSKEVFKFGYSLQHASCKDGSGVAVLYKQDKFNLISHSKGIFSGDNGNRTRAYVQLDLQDKSTQNISRVASMHLYGGTKTGNSLAREQIESFKKQIEQNSQDVSQIILAGDFNSDHNDELAQNLNGPCRFLLETKEEFPFSYHTTEEKIRTTNRSNRHLDWIFVGIKKDHKVLMKPDLEIVQLTHQIQHASDHTMHAIQLKGLKPLNTKTNQVERENIPSNIDKILGAKLYNKLMISKQINRQDVMDALHIGKEEASNTISEWIEKKILSKVGHGRDTKYISTTPLKPLSKESGERKSKPSLWERICFIGKAIFEALFSALDFLAHHHKHRSRNDRHHHARNDRPSHVPHEDYDPIEAEFWVDAS